MRPYYWTDADQAEQNVLLWAFLEAAEHHNAECVVCRQGPAYACQTLRDAWAEFEGWLWRRRLLSRALYCRVLENTRPPQLTGAGGRC